MATQMKHLWLYILRLSVPILAFGSFSVDSNAQDAQLIIEKLRRIRIPNIQFEQATIEEAITFLRIKSRELDDLEADPDRKGINFILKLPKDELGSITMSLSDVPLVVALKAITDLAGARYRLEPFAVIISSANDDNAELYTRVFQVRPDFAPMMDEEPATEGDNSGSDFLPKRVSAAEILEAQGVTFPEGASAFFNRTTSQLIVRNTAHNLELVQSAIEQNSHTVQKMVRASVDIYTMPLQASGLFAGRQSVADALVDAKKAGARLVASPSIVTRGGQRAVIQSGEEIEYIGAYVEKDGKDAPEQSTAFSGTRVVLDPIIGADGFTVDVNVSVTQGVGDAKVTTMKSVAPVSGKEVEISTVRVEELSLRTSATVWDGGIVHLGTIQPSKSQPDEARVVLLTIQLVDPQGTPIRSGGGTPAAASGPSIGQ
jgi:hypothetical protein